MSSGDSTEVSFLDITVTNFVRVSGDEVERYTSDSAAHPVNRTLVSNQPPDRQVGYPANWHQYHLEHECETQMITLEVEQLSQVCKNQR